MLDNLEIEIIKCNIAASEYDQKVVRLINAILDADRLLASIEKDAA